MGETTMASQLKKSDDPALEQLRAKSADPRFEKGFIVRLGRSRGEEGMDIVRGILESADFIDSMSKKIANSAAQVAKEMDKKAKEKSDTNTAGKFFDGADSAEAGKPIQLVFGAREDFFAGLEQLVGKPDPISLFNGMRKEHCHAEEGDLLTEDELVAMVFLLVIAGYETTVHLISNGVIELLRHPAELARLQEEVAELRRRSGVLERAMARAAIKTFPSNGQG